VPVFSLNFLLVLSTLSVVDYIVLLFSKTEAAGGARCVGGAVITGGGVLVCTRADNTTCCSWWRWWCEIVWPAGSRWRAKSGCGALVGCFTGQVPAEWTALSHSCPVITSLSWQTNKSGTNWPTGVWLLQYLIVSTTDCSTISLNSLV
jgi:hypothetical protein